MASLRAAAALALVDLLAATADPPPMKPFPPGCSFLPMAPSACYTDHDDSGRYPKYAGPRALPNDPPGCGMIGKKVDGEPVCKGKLMTPEYCAQACWTWKGYTMSAVATGKECWCGDSINPASVQEKDASKCTTACEGDASKKCGGFWLITVGELSPPGCASGTGGWLFVGGLLGGFSCYLVGGVLLNMQTRGKPAGALALPNIESWQHRLAGKRGGGGGGRGAGQGYSSLRGEEEEEAKVGKKEKKEKSEKKEKKEKTSSEKKEGKKEGKKEKRSSKEGKSPKADRVSSGGGGGGGGSASSSAGTAPAPAADGNAAGDGGRWVHVSI